MGQYSELKENMQIQGLTQIIKDGKEFSLSKSLLRMVFLKFRDFDTDIRDLIIFLRRDLDMSPILVIQYLICLFNIQLSEASILYQKYVPEPDSHQEKFHTEKVTL